MNWIDSRSFATGLIRQDKRLFDAGYWYIMTCGAWLFYRAIPVLCSGQNLGEVGTPYGCVCGGGEWNRELKHFCFTRMYVHICAGRKHQNNNWFFFLFVCFICFSFVLLLLCLFFVNKGWGKEFFQKFVMSCKLKFEPNRLQINFL